MALRDKIRLLFEVKDTPHRISMAFALGIFIGISPLFGIHTILGISLAHLFRLNRFVTIIAVYVTNPWTIIPIYTFCTWVGAKCLGIKQILPDIDWGHITFSMLLKDLGPLLMPFLLGTVLIGLLASVASYVIIYRLLKRRNA
ncbi:MAG TPA: DUF2062 domain-containing protein [Thermodesulfovibrionales bacterium]|nr:DUF2062 domain-containing protein [Thermodesulfovibrionales bacterium]